MQNDHGHLIQKPAGGCFWMLRDYKVFEWMHVLAVRCSCCVDTRCGCVKDAAPWTRCVLDAQMQRKFIAVHLKQHGYTLIGLCIG